MKRTALALGFSILALAALAQNEMDALRYSMTDFGGTARFSGMAGAFGALGGDFSSLSVNPAGLGIFRSSEVTVTPSLQFQTVESQFFGNAATDSKYDFNLNNLGVVFAFPLSRNSEEAGWKYFNLGFGMNRHNNFNTRWIAQGFNTQNSLMTSFLQQANREGSLDRLDDFSTGLAWDTYLLDMDQGEFFVDMFDGQVMQTQMMTTSGSVRELVISVGTNYNDILYLGATLGLPKVWYSQKGVLEETDADNRNDFFNALTFTEEFTTKGSGFNFKFGGIARLGNMVRLGASFHSPSFFKLEDEYKTSMRSDLDLDPEAYPGYTESAKFAQSPTGVYKYELNTPMKVIGSLGFVFGSSGLLSLDYEYTDYTSARLRSDDFSFSAANTVIQNNLNAQHAVRVGGEINIKPLVFRAGYGYYSSPYQKGINTAQRNVLAAGIGIRERNISVDFAFTHSGYSEDYMLYLVDAVAQSPKASRDFSRNAFRLTLGFRF